MIKVQKIILSLAIVLVFFMVANGTFFWQRLVEIADQTMGQPKSNIVVPEKTKITLSKNEKIISSELAPTKDYSQAPVALWVESLNIAVPIIYVEKSDEAEFQRGLKWGVVHYPGTAEIGEAGNAYIFGHSSDYLWSDGRFKTIFSRLPQIKIGAKIVAQNQQGEIFTYQVIATKVVSKNDISVLSQDDPKKYLLTLQTSYPVGTAQKRFVAVAELLSNSQK